MRAIFHCSGTVDVDSDKFMTWHSGSAMIGAAIFRNQKGNPSGPGEVAFNLSSMRKTEILDIRSESVLLMTECLGNGVV